MKTSSLATLIASSQPFTHEKLTEVIMLAEKQVTAGRTDSEFIAGGLIKREDFLGHPRVAVIKLLKITRQIAVNLNAAEEVTRLLLQTAGADLILAALQSVTSPRILVADDDSLLRVQFKDFLTIQGFQIAGEAGSGEQAIQMYTSAKPDIVMMDISMPGMGGIAAVKEIIATDPSAKVIMCSGERPDIVEQALRAGAKESLQKPFGSRLLAQTLQRYI